MRAGHVVWRDTFAVPAGNLIDAHVHFMSVPGAPYWRDAVDTELRGLVAVGRAADAHSLLLERLGG